MHKTMHTRAVWMAKLNDACMVTTCNSSMLQKDSGSMFSLLWLLSAVPREASYGRDGVGGLSGRSAEGRVRVLVAAKMVPGSRQRFHEGTASQNGMLQIRSQRTCASANSCSDLSNVFNLQPRGTGQHQPQICTQNRIMNVQSCHSTDMNPELFYPF